MDNGRQAQELFSLQGKTAILTGASGGLGTSLARSLAAAGAKVILAARRIDRLQQLKIDLQQHGFPAEALELDVTDPGSIERFFDATELISDPADILINNSGIAEPQAAIDQSEDDWQRVFAVNLDGARRMSVAFAQHLRQANTGGSIINVASILGIRQGLGVSAYATSKSALIQLTRQHALEWARFGIRVNALAPGYIETDMNRTFFESDAGKAMIKRIPQRRLGRPHELDGCLLLLASDAGNYITGSVLVADGGHTVSSL